MEIADRPFPFRRTSEAWLMRIDCIEDDRGVKGKLVVISIPAEPESHRWRESL